MSDLTFSEVSAANRERANRWHLGFPRHDSSGWSGADWSNAMVGEAGEAANIVKKLRRAECGLRGVLDAPPEGLVDALAEELADVVLYLMLLATYYDIDLPMAIVEKFNRVSEIQGFPERLGQVADKSEPHPVSPRGSHLPLSEAESDWTDSPPRPPRR